MAPSLSEDRATNRFVSADLEPRCRSGLRPDGRGCLGAVYLGCRWRTAASPQPPPGAPPGFSNLVWSDEFSGTSINAGNWSFDLGNGGFGNNELQNYTNRSQNARIENGMLVIEARRGEPGWECITHQLA